MKIVAILVPLAGLLTLGACNSPNPSSASAAASAPAAQPQKSGPKKIVGYADPSQATASYGEGLGDAGGGGHHH